MIATGRVGISEINIKGQYINLKEGKRIFGGLGLDFFQLCCSRRTVQNIEISGPK